MTLAVVEGLLIRWHYPHQQKNRKPSPTVNEALDYPGMAHYFPEGPTSFEVLFLELIRFPSGVWWICAMVAKGGLVLLAVVIAQLFRVVLPLNEGAEFYPKPDPTPSVQT
ncbi:hypothetical protein D0962_09425 [Leptolyngbyaceae cyanobacterium CCMR0082]|uniref:Uncharacterized protein n=1 Tax=Adonisia turfae CCMR0082 TaxID=2304604 RepID=A0A6M0S3V8_9CYAN|nr:hypothetical protein [Adonisia turfae]NEZ63000.1 hypothetical protein [Adonisia turfae CCMR0082]